MKRLAPAFLLLAALAAPAFAANGAEDSVTLTDGTRLHGQVIEDTDDHVTLLEQGAQRKFSRSRVLQVSYNNYVAQQQAPAASYSASAPSAVPADGYDMDSAPSLVPTDDPAATDYYNGVADHYSVPVSQVVYVQQQGVPMEEVPVVFELAARAHVAPRVVLGLRLGGLSWRDVGLHFGIGTDAFFVNVGVGTVAAPYRHLYTNFWHRPRRTWSKIVLSDNDIVDCVNLQFLSGQWHRPVREVMTYRGEGQRYHQIWAHYAPAREVRPTRLSYPSYRPEEARPERRETWDTRKDEGQKFGREERKDWGGRQEGDRKNDAGWDRQGDRKPAWAPPAPAPGRDRGQGSDQWRTGGDNPSRGNQGGGSTGGSVGNGDGGRHGGGTRGGSVGNGNSGNQGGGTSGGSVGNGNSGNQGGGTSGGSVGNGDGGNQGGGTSGGSVGNGDGGNQGGDTGGNGGHWNNGNTNSHNGSHGDGNSGNNDNGNNNGNHGNGNNGNR